MNIEHTSRSIIAAEVMNTRDHRPDNETEMDREEPRRKAPRVINEAAHAAPNQSETPSGSDGAVSRTRCPSTTVPLASESQEHSDTSGVPRLNRELLDTRITHYA